jgi:hypothetical protein
MKIKDYKKNLEIVIKDKMQNNYSYILSENYGENFQDDFGPYHTPQEMLEHGVFEGKYLNDCTNEFPEEWYKDAKTSKDPNIELNYFKIKSRQPLGLWISNGWILKSDPDVRGWFQWYCRYYIGRRDEVLDSRQIKRWKSFARHAGQIKANCKEGDLHCRPKQRQALLQWSYNPFI